MSPPYTLSSPVTGVFYAAPAPGETPFVAPGTQVKEGDVVCIVESMKVLIDVRSESAGVVRKVLVANEEQVSRDQPLMEIERDG